MVSSRLRTLGVCWLALICGACGHEYAVKERFEAEYGCHGAEVESLGGNAYRAHGCNARATYTCATDRGMGGPSSVCLKESASQVQAASPRATSAPVAQPPKIARRYDEERKIQIVQGDFRFTRGIRVTLVGAPAARLGEIGVEVTRPAYVWREQCSNLELLVNGVPTAAVLKRSRDTSVHESADYQFESFKPLAQRYPSFAVRLCGNVQEFSEKDVKALRQFLAIYSDLAIQEQAKQTEKDAPSSATDAGTPGVSL